MKVIRNILIVLLIVAIAACGFAYYKSRPILNSCKMLSSVESFDYTVRLHVDTTTSGNSGADSSDTKLSGAAKSFLFAMMENDWIFLEGEYADQVLHCECMSGAYENPILEFWYSSDTGNDGTAGSGAAADSETGSARQADELTLNLTPTIKCMFTKLTSANALAALAMEKLTENLPDMVITDTQLNAITGREIVPDTPEIPAVSKKDLFLASLTSADVQSEYFDSDDLEGKKYISLNTEEGENVRIGIGDVTSEETDNGKVDSIQLYIAAEIDGYPCEAMIYLRMPSFVGSITVPENQLTDEQLQIFRQIYEAVESYLQ